MMKTEVIRPKDITSTDMRSMLRLMQQYYCGVTPDHFADDIAKKDSVIVFRQDGQISGFTTILLVWLVVEGQEIRVFFSGDTIMAWESRNSVALPFAVARHMLRELDLAPDVPLYWLLTSKGYKTYRCLSVFLKDFHPQERRELSSFEHALLSVASEQLFKGHIIDRENWVMRAADSDQRLRDGMAEITDRLRRRLEIAYFERKNSGHERGDELMCIAPFTRQNIRPSLLRKLEAI